jgi:transposase
MNIIAGVDCYKASHTVAFLDQAGRLVDKLTIANSPEGFDEAFECGSRLAQSVSWGLESVGSYGRAFAKYLLDRGASVFDVPPASTKRRRKHPATHRHTAAIDMRAVAEVVLRDAESLGRFDGEGVRDELRLFDDCRERLIQDRSQVLNRMRQAALVLGLKPLPKVLHRPHALAGLRAQLDRIDVHAAVSGALVTEVRFGARRIEMLNEQIAEVERSLDPLVSRLFHETASRSAPSALSHDYR